ncbi:hypothetical protein CEXT_687781 [Caerostris extrusa]|uniref:Uncharacterized protein n=1 Tax=Caerostris extrusa TaxID=172846 RepID=A0AAV4QQE2_CAEEX|nr:hypothetical protein CEXT_687781 [Caerostris extrusa]
MRNYPQCIAIYPEMRDIYMYGKNEKGDGIPTQEISPVPRYKRFLHNKLAIYEHSTLATHNKHYTDIRRSIKWLSQVLHFPTPELGENNDLGLYFLQWSHLSIFSTPYNYYSTLSRHSGEIVAICNSLQDLWTTAFMQDDAHP